MAVIQNNHSVVACSTSSVLEKMAHGHTCGSMRGRPLIWPRQTEHVLHACRVAQTSRESTPRCHPPPSKQKLQLEKKNVELPPVCNDGRGFLFTGDAALCFDGELLVTGGSDRTVRVQRNSRDHLEDVS